MKKSLYLLLLLTFTHISIYALDNFKLSPEAQLRVDSILKITDTLPHDKRLIRCYQEISYEYINTSTEIFFLKKAYDEAIAQGVEAAAVYMMGNMTSNYLNRNIDDSLYYWTEKLRPMAIKNGRYDDLFDALSYCCQSYMKKGNYEEAMRRAEDIGKMAEELDNKIGLIVAFENIGYIYMETHRPQEAIDAYIKGFNLVKDISGRSGYTLQFLENIIPAMFMLENIQGAEKYLNEYISFFNKCMDEKVNGIYPDTNGFFHTFINNNLVELYVKKGEIEKAANCFKNLEKRAPTEINGEFNNSYYYVAALYHHAIHSEALALKEITAFLKSYKTPQGYKLQAQINASLGEFKNAMQDYQALCYLSDSIGQLTLQSQVNALKVKLDLDNLEIKNQELEIETARKSIIMTVSIALLLFVILIVITFFLIRTNKLKNKLLKSRSALLIAKDDAELANRMKSSFLQNISHEIRTPLNAITGFSQILSESIPQDGDTDSREYGKIIRENSAMLLKLIDDMIETSEFEAEKRSFSLSQCDIISICQKSIDELKSEIKPGIDIQFIHKDEVLRATTDAFRLQQVINNLLNNANKFTTQGSITLEVVKLENQFRITITDTGIGIPHNKAKVIFQEFEKLDSFSQGNGLGLSICRYITEKLNGRVYLDTSYKNGARFVVEHPIDLQQKSIGI